MFVDASPEPGKNPYVSGDYDFSPLLARIQYAINKVKATRVSMDSLGAIFSYLPDKSQVRDDLFIIASALRDINATAILTSERNYEYNERCIYFAFEENRHQLMRNARGWGIDFAEAEKEGRLKILFRYPESTRLENHLIRMQEVIEEFKPDRVVIDSLTALEKVATLNGFREFIASLNATIRGQGITGLYTATAATLLGGNSITQCQISTSTDSIILLRYVEVYGEVRRGLAVIKMRGSMHDKQIREFVINNNGMHIGRSFRNVTGILSGNPIYVDQDEVNRLSELFKDINRLIILLKRK